MNRNAVHAVSYATGEAGGRLKWLPRRTPAVVAASGVDDGQPAPISDGTDALDIDSGTVERAITTEESESVPEDWDASPGNSLPMPLFPTAQDATRAPKSPAAAEPPVLMETPDASEAPEELSAEDLGGTTSSLLDETGEEYRNLESQLRKCPSAADFKKITEITTSIKPEEGEFPYECDLGNEPFQPRSWCPITYTWTAAVIGHKPLYFEDAQLERYGHSWGPLVQPFMSMAHFYLTVPVLPYKMGLEPPNECIYELGYYRPGSCAPYMLDPLPLSVRAALFEGGVWTGGIFLIP